jgi:hypothetical protein
MREVPPGRVEGGPTTVSPGSSDTVGRPVRFGRVWAGLWVVKTRGGAQTRSSLQNANSASTADVTAVRTDDAEN